MMVLYFRPINQFSKYMVSKSRQQAKSGILSPSNHCHKYNSQSIYINKVQSQLNYSSISLFLLHLLALPLLNAQIPTLSIQPTNPESHLHCLLRQTLQHSLVHLRQIQHILNTVLPVIRINGPLAEETQIALTPHLVILVLILIYTVTRLILLQNLVEPRSFHTRALSDDIFGIVEQLFLVFFFAEQLFIALELIDQSLSGTRIEDIDDTALDHFMQSDGVVPAVVENLNNFGIHHHISQYLSGQPERLEFSSLIHVPNIDEESVSAVVELNHLHKSPLPQSALQIHSQHSAFEQMRRTHDQRIEVVDVVRFSLYQIHFLEHGEFLQSERLLEVAFAGLLSELLEQMGVQLRMVDELNHREEYEVVVLQDEVWFDLIDYVRVIVFESFGEIHVEVIPSYQCVGQLLFQIGS